MKGRPVGVKGNRYARLSEFSSAPSNACRREASCYHGAMQPLRTLKHRYRESGRQNAGFFLETSPRPADRTLRCRIPIVDAAEPMQPLPDIIARRTPHPYQQLGAPYGDTEPYALRKSVVTRLLQAQAHLEHRHPGHRLQVFDAYRPLAVQAFMIEHESARLAAERGEAWETLTPARQASLRKAVRQFWAPPNHDPGQPPPHSTGAALDLQILDAHAEPLAMGSPIDHIGPESLPHYFAEIRTAEAAVYQGHRNLLNDVMSRAGFRRLPHEWWHFSYGDQWWALLMYLERDDFEPAALYGRADVDQTTGPSSESAA